MKNILFAFNHADTESHVSGLLGDGYNILPSLTYREAILSALDSMPVDVIVVGYILPGSVSFKKLFEDIRLLHPHVRIVFFCEARRRGDIELADFVGLGIYDIISKDTLAPQEVVDYIKHPRDFSSVAHFYLSDFRPLITVVDESEQKPVRGGLFSGIKGKKKDSAGDHPESVYQPKVDVNTLRKTIKAEAEKEARQELDDLIKKAVEDKSVEQTAKIEDLLSEQLSMKSILEEKDSRIATLVQDIATGRIETSNLEASLKQVRADAKETISVYETQLNSLSKEVESPKWFAEQQASWDELKIKLTDEVTACKLETDVLRSQIKSQDNSDEHIEKLASELETSKSVIADFERQLAESNLSKVSNSETLASLSEKLVEIEALKKSETRLQSELDESLSKLADLEGELSGEQRGLEDIQSSLRECQEKLLATESELRLKCEAHDNSLEAIKKVHQAEIDELRIRHDTELADARQKVANSIGEVTASLNDSVIEELRRNQSELQLELDKKTASLDDAMADLKLFVGGAPVYGNHPSTIPYQDDSVEWTHPTKMLNKVTAVIGAKHGVGNTTVAMNLAANLANGGEKVLFVEFNNRFPLSNEFFELTNVPLGIADCMESAKVGDMTVVDASILRFWGMKATSRSMDKVYKKLPSGFHVLTYANKDLRLATDMTPIIPTKEAMFALFAYLQASQKYSHIVLDIQPDERHLLGILVDAGISISQLVVTMSQDPHGIASAGTIVSALAKTSCSKIISNAYFVVNKYNTATSPTTSKISKFLHVSSNRVLSLSEDTVGYNNAAIAGLPYVLNGGTFAQEHEKVRIAAI